jgi:hypothetical protein
VNNARGRESLKKNSHLFFIQVTNTLKLEILVSYFSSILIEDIPLCFNSKNKTNNLLRQKHTTILYNYWHFVMATCFGLSLDHLQAIVLNREVQSMRTVYCGIQY